MSLEFIMTNTAAEFQGIKALVYGRSGAGKTTLARTLPNVLILSAEAGLLSLQDQKIPGIRIRHVQDLTDALEWLRHAPEAKQFQNVFMDSITEIAEQVLANAKTLVKDPRQAYGELIEKMTATIKAYRDLPVYNVIMTAKQESHQDEVTKMTLYGPSMPGNKMAQGLPYLFDEVFRIGIAKTSEGKDYRYIQTGPDLQHEAKDRSGALAQIEPPDLGVIFQKILAKKA